MMRSQLLVAAVISLVCWIGCGDDIAGQCQKGCQKATACGNSTDTFCAQNCAATISKWRDDFRNAFFTCYLDGKTMNCVGDVETCYTSASTSVQPRVIDTSYRNACLDRRSQCMNSFADDYCLQSLLYDSSVVDSAMSCLGRPCDQISTCLRSTFGG
jgi:hypothetical protein